MNIVIERYERLAVGQLKDLRDLQKKAMNKNTDSQSVRDQIERVSQQLQSGIAQILAERGNLEPDEQERFDARTEPIRKQIQSALHATNSLPPLKSKNPFLDEDSDDVNPYEAESKRRVCASYSRKCRK
ncbi:unnamed protein product [Nippostrongylus brasiliensis]|uniref:t-SNARE coiled-coil homology domain-containing protein n=1 Tax=Nippostrongylus brasiliensis TaxID=27835 RepID=A0A0N4XPW4_NIPBR|nr:unnamed protein product [Nippostrongylus brasiliensis]